MNKKIKTVDKVIFVVDIVLAVLYIFSHIMQWIGFVLIPAAVGNSYNMEVLH